MFDGIKKHWAKARADVLSDQVTDILLRYQRMHSNDRHWVTSAFKAVLSELEDQFGPMESWADEQKKQIAKQVMESSQQAFATRGDNIFAETGRLGSYGGALLSLYLELQTLPGNQAAKNLGMIENWRSDLVQ
jgi:hypothetical protein